jgi:hypothetical protein
VEKVYQTEKDEDFIHYSMSQDRKTIKRIKKRYFEEFMTIDEINKFIEDI